MAKRWRRKICDRIPFASTVLRLATLGVFVPNEVHTPIAMKALDFVAIASMLVSLATVPFILFFWGPGSNARKKSDGWARLADITMSAFVISCVVGVCACCTSQEIARSTVIQNLDSAGDDYRISINGKTAPNGQQVLLALKALQWTPGHHSNPTKRIGVDLFSDSHHIFLSLARDSDDPREYWVYYPNYRITAMNEIGRIKTPIFDGY